MKKKRVSPSAWEVSWLAHGARKHRARTLDPAGVAVDDDRLQELVRLVLRVLLLNRLHWVFALLPFALDETVDRDLDTLPTLVTVHGVVATNDGGDLAVFLLLQEGEEVLRVSRGGAGGCVATVAEKVDIDVGDFLLLRGLEERVEVVDVGVYTTVRDLYECQYVVRARMRAGLTRPRRCKRPFPSLARLQLSRMTSFLWN